MCISQFVPMTQESMFTKTCTAFCLDRQKSFFFTGMSKLEAASRFFFFFSEIHGESTTALITTPCYTTGLGRRD